MRIPVIAGNWKMNLNVAQSLILVNEMLSDLEKIKGIEKVLCPPFTSLKSLEELTKGTSVRLGAQNMYYKDKGAYTGEISPAMLVDICDFVILGHSERRQYFNETDAIVNQKVKVALKSGLIPILCVGESLEENEAKQTETVISRQVIIGLANIEPSAVLVIAYEPVWAIGTGRAATGEQANTTISLIRKMIKNIWNQKVSNSIRILYGGSVTSANIGEYISQDDIDGALVGGASLKADEFISIVTQTASIKNNL